MEWSNGCRDHASWVFGSITRSLSSHNDVRVFPLHRLWLFFFFKLSQINLSLAYSRHAVPLLEITYLHDIGIAIRWSDATTSTVAVANFTLNAETLQWPFQYYTSCYFCCWCALCNAIESRIFSLCICSTEFDRFWMRPSTEKTHSFNFHWHYRESMQNFICFSNRIAIFLLNNLIINLQYLI